MEPILEAKRVSKKFAVKAGFLQKTRFVHAVDDVDLQIFPGESLGIVGESGCGKSTLGRTLIRLNDASSGNIFFEGKDITHERGAALRELRKRMQIVFQDPFSSLNPRMTVYQTLAEPYLIHYASNKVEIKSKILELLEKVGLSFDAAGKYPHEFSGGQRQRIGIARALALQPKLIVADEPVSALDVSIQSQILNLLADLRDQLGLSYVFISHDLSVVNFICDRVAVMYLGKIVEIASKERLYAHPSHPYTQLLLSSIPRAGIRRVSSLS
jgi:ABC-type oligopeptide transport system ATPase subunit